MAKSKKSKSKSARKAVKKSSPAYYVFNGKRYARFSLLPKREQKRRRAEWTAKAQRTVAKARLTAAAKRRATAEKRRAAARNKLRGKVEMIERGRTPKMNYPYEIWSLKFRLRYSRDGGTIDSAEIDRDGIEHVINMMSRRYDPTANFFLAQLVAEGTLTDGDKKGIATDFVNLDTITISSAIEQFNSFILRYEFARISYIHLRVRISKVEQDAVRNEKLRKGKRKLRRN